MLITFARHSNNAIRGRAVSPSDFLPLTDYMDGPSVSKRVAGKWIEVARSPVPEVLVGKAPLSADRSLCFHMSGNTAPASCPLRPRTLMSLLSTRVTLACDARSI